MKIEKVNIHGEPSYRLTSATVNLNITARGGHLAPVYFKLGNRTVAPFSLSPWKPKDLPSVAPPLISVLRGDFLCLPFGESKSVSLPHGETANRHWQLLTGESQNLVMEMQVDKPKCRVRKTLTLKNGQNCIYQEHLISGLKGRFNFGHHAILQFPEKGGPFYVNTSPFFFGGVKPEAFSNPLNREYGALKTGARFRSLSRVPLASGGVTSLNCYPSRRGFEDLIMVVNRKTDFAWTAATLDGYIWFSLKNPCILPSTLFWISNGGRHSEPWCGRHLNRLGLEEVCSHFCDGLETSRKDLLKHQNIPTTRLFSAKSPTSVRVIQGVHAVPKGFGLIAKIIRDRTGRSIIVSSKQGRKVIVPVDWKFLNTI